MIIDGLCDLQGGVEIESDDAKVPLLSLTTGGYEYKRDHVNNGAPVLKMGSGSSTGMSMSLITT
jgi:hypothetical protein